MNEKQKQNALSLITLTLAALPDTVADEAQDAALDRVLGHLQKAADLLKDL